MNRIADRGLRIADSRRIADFGLRIADSETSAGAPRRPRVSWSPISAAAATPDNPQSAIRNPQSISPQSEILSESAIHNPQSAIERSTIRNPQSVELHIEELVLHGFEPGRRYLISEALERELMRLFIEQGLPPSLRNGIEVARVDGGVFRVAGGAKAETVGSQVAQAVYGGLTR